MIKLLTLILSIFAPVLTLPSVTTAPGPVDVPITFSGSQINSTLFEIEYNPDAVEFIGADFDLASVFVADCQSPEPGILQCWVFGFASPLPEIPSGEIGSLHFYAKSSTDLSLTYGSFGSIYGQSVPGELKSGYVRCTSLVRIFPEAVDFVLIPFVTK